MQQRLEVFLKRIRRYIPTATMRLVKPYFILGCSVDDAVSLLS